MRWIALIILAACTGCAASRPVMVTATQHRCGDVSVSITIGE
jgi:hypothetical protein